MCPTEKLNYVLISFPSSVFYRQCRQLLPVTTGIVSVSSYKTELTVTNKSDSTGNLSSTMWTHTIIKHISVTKSIIAIKYNLNLFSITSIHCYPLQIITVLILIQSDSVFSLTTDDFYKDHNPINTTNRVFEMNSCPPSVILDSPIEISNIFEVPSTTKVDSISVRQH